MSNVQVSYYSLNAIEGAVSRLQNQMANVDIKVDSVANMQSAMADRLQALSDLVEDYIRQDILDKSLALAQSQLIDVRAQLGSEFGHHKVVRRMATGVVQAVDTGIVTQDIIRSSTEEVMIQTPRYWLAPALVALAAWLRDDRPLAERALREAIARDADRTSLLFLLLTRRFRRYEAVGLWLHPYLDRQDPTALSREFVIIMDGVAWGAFGQHARQTTNLHMERWMAELEQNPGFGASQVKRWKQAFAAYSPTAQDGEFPYLAHHANAQEWAWMKHLLGQARSYEPLAEHFGGILLGELVMPSRLEHQIDEIIDRLVTEFDPEELPLREREAYLELVLESGGDHNSATAKSDVRKQALQATNDFGQMLTNAAMATKDSGASLATKRWALAMTKHWVEQAHAERVAELRAGLRDSAGIEVDGWQGRLTLPADEQELVASVRTFTQQRTDAAIAAVQVPPFRKGVAFVGAALAVLLLIPAFPLALLCAGLSVWGFFGWYGLDARREQLRKQGEQELQANEATVRTICAEWTDFHRAWQSADAKAARLTDLLNSVDPEQMMATPIDATREVI